jgi:uncharacterized protein (DUF697 family)
MRASLLAALLHVIPVPAPDVNALPPVTIEDAREYCEAYGGQWNEYSNEDDTARWYECDEPTGESSDDPEDDQ